MTQKHYDTKTFGMKSRACGNKLKEAGYAFDYDKWSWSKDGAILFDGSGMTWAQSTYNAYQHFLDNQAAAIEAVPVAEVAPQVDALASDSTQDEIDAVESYPSDAIQLLKGRIATLQAQLAKHARINLNLAEGNAQLKAENARVDGELDTWHELAQELCHYAPLEAHTTVKKIDILRNWIEILQVSTPSAPETPKRPKATRARINWNARGFSSGSYPIEGFSNEKQTYVLNISTDPNRVMLITKKMSDCEVVS